MTTPGSIDEARTRIDARVMRSGPNDSRRQHTLPCPDVEDLLALAGIQQLERDGQHDALVVATPLPADPPVVPRGLAIPRR
jgi:anion-transporting  ArsA/GET3 family ATPase